MRRLGGLSHCCSWDSSSVLLPIWIPLGDAVVWTWYAVGIVGAVVIGLFASRWYRVTTLEQGKNYRVVRVEHLRGRKRSGGDSSEARDSSPFARDITELRGLRRLGE